MKNMERKNFGTGMSDDCFYGSVTVGEKGQIVIPADARAEMKFQPGDKLLIMRHPVHQGLSIFKLEAVREFLDDFYTSLEAVAKREGHDDPAPRTEKGRNK